MNSREKITSGGPNTPDQTATPDAGAFVFNVRNLVKPEKPRTSEAQEAIDWYMEQLRTLPEIHTEVVPATDGSAWIGTITPEGQVEKIENAKGGFFSIEGRRIKRGSFEWTQPALIQSGEWIKTKSGEKRFAIALVLMVTDPEGKVFLTVGDESLAPTMDLDGKQIRPVVKTPMQTSMTKMKQILEGDRDKDKNFSALLDIVKGEKSIEEFIQDLDLISAPTDGNRMEANVLFGSLNVTQDVADRIQAAIPGGKFLTRPQISTLTEFGALNGIALTGMAIKDATGSLPQNGVSN